MDASFDFETITDGWGKSIRVKRAGRRAHAEVHRKPSPIKRPPPRIKHKQDVRIGKCPHCGRRYGFVPTAQDRIDPNADRNSIIERPCAGLSCRSSRVP